MNEFVPLKQQKIIFNELVNNRECMLFVDMGLGKTSGVLMYLEYLKTIGADFKALVISTKNIINSTWPDEIEEFGWDLTYSVVHGRKKPERIQVDADIHLCTFQGIEWIVDQPEFSQYTILIIDEITKLKSTDSTAWRALKKPAAKIKKRIGMTGMPIPRGYIDLFGQMFIIDRGKSLGTRKSEFEQTYFKNVGTDYKMLKMKTGADDLIKEKMKGRALILDSDDYLDIPDFSFNDIYIDMPRKLRKIYDRLEQDFFLDCDNMNDEEFAVEIEAANSGSLSNKLREFCTGSVYDIEKEPTEFHRMKIQVIKEELSDLDTPAMVGFNFKHERDVLLQELKGSLLIGSGTSGAVTRERKQQWNNGEIPWLIGNPASVAHGMNLQHGGRHLILNSLTWNLDDYWQLIKRLHRTGQKLPVVVHRILFRDTIEERVAKRINEKGLTQDDFVNFLKKHNKKWK